MPKTETTLRCIHGRTEKQPCSACRIENENDRLHDRIRMLGKRLKRIKRPSLRLSIGNEMLKAERKLRSNFRERMGDIANGRD